MARLEVEIGADITGLEKALNQAEVDMIKFARGIKKGGDAIPPFNKKVVNAVPAMTSFSQTIQDAPFGIQGMANNIQQLTAQLGYLSTQSGGAKNALKEMLSTLKGPAGILLAVSVITVLMQLFARRMQKAKKEALGFNTELEKLVKTANDTAKGLEAIEKAQFNGEKSAQKELTTLRALVEQVENTNTSTEQRIKGINTLRKKYPKMLADISDEEVLLNGVGTAYENLADGIMMKAKAQAAANLITSNANKALLLQLRLEKNILEFRAQRAKDDARVAVLQTQLAQGGKGVAAVQFQIQNAYNKSNALLEEQTDLSREIGTLGADNLRLFDEIQNQGGLGGDSGAGANNERKLFEGRFKALQFYTKQAWDLEKETQDALASLRGMGLKQAEVVELSAGERRLRNQRYIQTQSEEMAHAHYVRLQLQLQAFNQAASDIINTGITDTLGGLGEAIGGAIGEGTNVLQAGGKALLEGLADIVIRLGKLAIATGVGMEAIKTAFKTFGGLGAIAAGVALVALGSAIKGAIGNIGSDLGGTGSAGSDIPTGSNPSFSEGGGQIILTVEGTQLIGVINNTTRQDISMGGSIGILGR